MTGFRSREIEYSAVVISLQLVRYIGANREQDVAS